MTYEEMRRDFDGSYAEKSGVIFPKSGTQSAATLLYYWQNQGHIITKSQAEEHVFNNMLNETPRDLQELRHLGTQKGFAILKGGDEYNGVVLKRKQYVFIGFDKVNPFWSKSRRDETNLNFEELLASYGERCATCGARSGEKHYRTNSVVVLEKGHMNPDGDMSNSNIIPQCGDCNRYAKNYFIFDTHGRVRTLTSRGISKLVDRRSLLEGILQHKSFTADEKILIQSFTN